MDDSLTVKIFDDASALATAAAQTIASIASEAVSARGRFTVALSGGGTPRETYMRLAQPRRGRRAGAALAAACAARAARGRAAARGGRAWRRGSAARASRRAPGGGSTAGDWGRDRGGERKRDGE